MTEHFFTLETLRTLAVTTLEIHYSADSTDSLTFDLLPKAYEQLTLAPGDRITVTHNGNVIFSGIMPAGIHYAANAGQNEVATITAYSDFYVLEQTAYTRLDSNNQPIYPAVTKNSETTSLQSFTHGIFNYAANWQGSAIRSSFSCSISDTIPTPRGNGSTPCGQLMRDALKWTPNAIILQRYDANGGSLQITTPDRLETLELPKNAPIISAQLVTRPDLVPPVCALIGATHAIYPSGGDVRQMGAFVYTVPQSADQNNRRAGSAAASQKNVIKGIPIPERHAYNSHPQEYQYSDIVADTDTFKFFKHCFPDYAQFLPYAKSGSAFIFITPKNDLYKDEESEDEETKQAPANYSDTPETWAAGNASGIYVMTEGSFTASTRSTKNLRGLKWCKAKITVMLAVPRSGMPSELHPTAAELFPGMVKINGDKYGFARLTLECILINRSKRIYDPATNTPCSTDAEYNSNVDESLTLADYRNAMLAYYNASRIIYTEGNITMLDNDTINPAELTGRPVVMLGKRNDWATMNAIIRAVTWNANRRIISFTVGTRAQLSFDEYLERRRLNRATARQAAQRLAISADINDIDAQEEIEEEMTVSPTITPGIVPTTRGRARKPGTLYPVKTQDGEESIITYWLAGGVISKGTTRFIVEDSDEQITNGTKNGLPWQYGKPIKVKFTYDTNRNITNFSIYQ